MTSVEYRKQYNTKKRDTLIEKITQTILFENDIDFIKHYLLDGYEFDLFLPKLNILIECDGDYWHGKGVVYTELNEVQKKSKQNDLIKTNIAEENNIKLLRFWESEIKDKNFEKTLLNILNVKN